MTTEFTARDVVQCVLEGFLGFGLFFRAGFHTMCVLLASPGRGPEVTVGVVLDPIRDPANRPLWNRLSASLTCVVWVLWWVEVAPLASIGATGPVLAGLYLWLIANAAVLLADPLVQLAVATQRRSNTSQTTPISHNDAD